MTSRHETTAPKIVGRSARILIVDDDEDHRQLLASYLSRDGLVIATAKGGLEALGMIEVSPPDLVLLDVMMPDVSGLQVVSKIKTSPSTKGILVVMISALKDRNAKLLALNAGADEFLTKPVKRVDLSSRVNSLLGLSGQRDEELRAMKTRPE